VREEAERLEKLSPEEIEEMEKSIPEWKRNALVTTDEAVIEEKIGLFKRLKVNAKSKFNETEFAQNYYESEDYKKIEEARDEFSEFKTKLKDEVEMS